MVRKLVKILGISARNVVKMARSEMGALGGQPRTSPAREISEAVMGRIAWDVYKNLEYKRMTGSRKPTGSTASAKLVTARNKKMGGSMSGWTLENEPEHFTGVDTRWRMDDRLTWLPLDGDVTGRHIGTLGDMISEAFYAHKRKERELRNRATKERETRLKEAK